MKAELAKGFMCVCGEEHKYSTYVYAHWDESLLFTCPKCQQKWNVLKGKAIKHRTKKPKKETTE